MISAVVDSWWRTSIVLVRNRGPIVVFRFVKVPIQGIRTRPTFFWLEMNVWFFFQRLTCMGTCWVYILEARRLLHRFQLFLEVVRLITANSSLKWSHIIFAVARVDAVDQSVRFYGWRPANHEAQHGTCFKTSNWPIIVENFLRRSVRSSHLPCAFPSLLREASASTFPQSTGWTNRSDLRTPSTDWWGVK